MLTEVLERPASSRFVKRQDLADRYSGMACLLNGELAQIVGRRLDYQVADARAEAVGDARKPTKETRP
jgi:hypothetical protein